ncbi:hypothetical protein [Pelagicoccus albus]|uniref:hypothetical protein n=1 Tax=Pelagicoccus albus TaxID=415222 RepID=UPI0030D825A1
MTLQSVYFNLVIMKASILDLRYKTKDVLKALERNETVSISYRGKEKGRIYPVEAVDTVQAKVSEHAFFASAKEEESVDELMDCLRGDRY